MHLNNGESLQTKYLRSGTVFPDQIEQSDLEDQLVKDQSKNIDNKSFFKTIY